MAAPEVRSVGAIAAESAIELGCPIPQVGDTLAICLPAGHTIDSPGWRHGAPGEWSPEGGGWWFKIMEPGGA